MFNSSPREEVHKRIAKSEVDIDQYQPLVNKIVNSYVKCYGDIAFDNRDDLLQEGYIGLIKAKKTYDPERGTFVTHGYRCATSEINKKFKKLVDEYKRSDLSIDRETDGTGASSDHTSDAKSNVLSHPGTIINYESIGRMLNHEHRKLYWCLYNGLNTYKTCAMCDIPYKDYSKHLANLREEIVEILKALSGETL